MVRIAGIIGLFLIVLDLHAQQGNAFATASVNRTEVLLEQPVKIKISAYSATWFASPLSFDNLQVEGAFLQSFKQTQSSIKYIDKKKYAALEFYYILFPYREGEVVFPELTITVDIPPEGDYKGKPVVLKTKPIRIKVNSVPEGGDPVRWLVANDLIISETWSIPTSSVRVGDVMERTISISAKGTLPTFIDEADVGEVDFASIYTSEPRFIDERDNQQTNGRRVDSYSYLLEREGSFSLPEVEVSWWNPYAGRYYKRVLPEVKVVVGENPDLASLEALRDSLNALNQSLSMEGLQEEKPLNWRRWILRAGAAGLVLLFAWILVRLFGRLRQRIRREREAYVDSEGYWYRRVLKQQNARDMINHLYHWLDRAKNTKKAALLSDYCAEEPILKEDVEKMVKSEYSGVSKPDFSISKVKRTLSRLRRRRKNPGKNISETIGLKPLNP
jgi:hypothetical protein